MSDTQKSVSDRPADSIEEARLRLRKGLYTQYEGFAYRCLVFHLDMHLALDACRITKKRKLEGLLEVYPVSASVALQYQALLAQERVAEGLGQLALFGMLQCISQTIEATLAVATIFGVRDAVLALKQREYWKFRNRHTHVETQTHVRSNNTIDVFDVHVFALEAMTAESLRYKSISDDQVGFAVRPVSVRNMIRELDCDLMGVFELILERAKASD